jgi:hypothetical protein
MSKLVEKYKKFVDGDCQQIYCGGNSGVSVSASIILIATIVTIVTKLF